jgi:hypothetical protein
MARCKTTPRKQVMRVQPSKYPEIDWMLERPSESHDDGKTASYFLRELRSMLRTLDYHPEPLDVSKKTPLHNKGYRWEVHVALYEKPRGTGGCHVRRVHHASTSRATLRQAFMMLLARL